MRKYIPLNLYNKLLCLNLNPTFFVKMWVWINDSQADNTDRGNKYL